jgi:hypothetical protein
VSLSRDDRAEIADAIRREVRACSLAIEGPVMEAPLPADITAERHVLSTMWEGDSAPRWLLREHFALELHRHLFAILSEMMAAQRERGPVDTHLVLEALVLRGWRPTRDLIEEVRAIELFGWRHIEPLARRIVEMARRRDALLIIAKFDALSRVTSTDTAELVRLLDEARSVLAPRRSDAVRAA